VKSRLPESELAFNSSLSEALTDKTVGYLIEAYSNIARVAWSSTTDIASKSAPMFHLMRCNNGI